MSSSRSLLLNDDQLDNDTVTDDAGSDLAHAKPTAIGEILWNRHQRDPSRREQTMADLLRALSGRHSVLTVSAATVVGGVVVENGELTVWAIDPADPLRPVPLSLVIDGQVRFEQDTAPTTDHPVYPTGHVLRQHKRIELRAGGESASGGPFTARTLWDDAAVRESLSNYLNWVGEIEGEANSRNELRTHLPDVMNRLDGRKEDGNRSRVPTFCRYLAGRLNSNIKLAGALSVANWIVSDVFENPDRRAIFCLTNGTLAILREPVFNRRAVKNDISLALFAFWRRHYPHVDVFSEDGLRLVQYKFATAPFVADKNNGLLVSDDLRRSLSAPASVFRNRELPWSWYWLFLLEDQGQAERMKDEQFALVTSFKEVILDVAINDRVSFSPTVWRAYWSTNITPDFTRFDLAVISILADVAAPEVVIEELGADHWRERLGQDVYARIPALLALSGQHHRLVTRRPDVPMRDVVVIGHANQTGLGRNLSMFVEALTELDPLVMSADDGSCINPDAGFNPDVGVRARVVLLCVNAHRAPEMIARFASVCEGAHIIGFYVWETDRPPETHTLGASVVDEIWTPTNYVADAYRKVATAPVHMVRKGLHDPQRRNPNLDRFRRSDGEFLFLCVADFGSSIVRKNPLDVIKAFQGAFEAHDHDVRLLIKIRDITPGHWSNVDGYWEEVEDRVAHDPRIDFVEGDLTEQEYWTLMWTIDAIVSLHRSEGFGYTLADAMMVEKALVVSDYSGSQDFCDTTTSFPVEVLQMPAPPELLASQGYIGNWSSPVLASAMDAMRQAVTEPETRAARAAAAKNRIFADYGFEHWRTGITARVRERLDRPARGVADA